MPKTVAPPRDPDPDVRLQWLANDTATKVERRQAKFSRWKAVGFWLSGVAAVLTAVAGLSIMTEWLSRNQAGVLAVVAAVVTALVAAYDPARRTVRMAVERAEWTRLLGDVQELQADRAVTRAQGRPASREEVERLGALWQHHCDLSRGDAEARDLG